jgi:hypothetical protein
MKGGPKARRKVSAKREKEFFPGFDPYPNDPNWKKHAPRISKYKKNSMAAMARHFPGIVSGPGDLSTREGYRD